MRKRAARLRAALLPYSMNCKPFVAHGNCRLNATCISSQQSSAKLEYFTYPIKLDITPDLCIIAWVCFLCPNNLINVSLRHTDTPTATFLLAV